MHMYYICMYVYAGETMELNSIMCIFNDDRNAGY
jgi:hypothetical protein